MAPALVAGALWLAAPALPADVQRFLERREQCDHFRGEEAYDAQRRAEILAGACRWCAGTDAELARLRAAHRKSPGEVHALEAFDERVEPADDPCPRDATSPDVSPAG